MAAAGASESKACASAGPDNALCLHLVMPYCTVDTLIHLAAVSREFREAVCAPSRWRHVVMQGDVHGTSVHEVLRFLQGQRLARHVLKITVRRARFGTSARGPPRAVLFPQLHTVEAHGPTAATAATCQHVFQGIHAPALRRLAWRSAVNDTVLRRMASVVGHLTALEVDPIAPGRTVGVTDETLAMFEAALVRSGIVTRGAVVLRARGRSSRVRRVHGGAFSTTCLARLLDSAADADTHATTDQLEFGWSDSDSDGEDGVTVGDAGVPAPAVDDSGMVAASVGNTGVDAATTVSGMAEAALTGDSAGTVRRVDADAVGRRVDAGAVGRRKSTSNGAGEGNGSQMAAAVEYEYVTAEAAAAAAGGRSLQLDRLCLGSQPLQFVPAATLAAVVRRCNRDGELRSLGLTFSHLNEEAMSTVLRHCGTLQELTVVTGDVNFTDDCLRSIVRACPNLTSLNVHCPCVETSWTSAGVQHVAFRLRHLRRLRLGGFRANQGVTAGALALLADRLPHLTDLYLQDATQLTGEDTRRFLQATAARLQRFACKSYTGDGPRLARGALQWLLSGACPTLQALSVDMDAEAACSTLAKRVRTRWPSAIVCV